MLHIGPLIFLKIQILIYYYFLNHLLELCNATVFDGRLLYLFFNIHSFYHVKTCYERSHLSLCQSVGTSAIV